MSKTMALIGTILVFGLVLTACENSGPLTSRGEGEHPQQPLMAPHISLAGSVVSWNAVAGAGGYRVRIGGALAAGGELGAGARSFDLADLGLGSGSHVVTVVAVHPSIPSLNSPPSNAVTFTVTAGQPGHDPDPDHSEEDFTIGFADFVDMAPDIAIVGPTIRHGNRSPFTVANPNQYDYGSIRWIFNGIQIYGAIVSGDYGETLVLGPLIQIHGNMLGVGAHFLTVEVSINSVPYSRRIAFTVAR